jgi:outer membrane protein assembly factor BamB
MFRSIVLAVCSFTVFALSVSAARGESNWPGWRGPAGTGASEETDLPVNWNDHQVRWKTALIGQGHSSPVVWGDRIFLTSASEDGGKRIVMCLSRTSGELLWDKVAWTGKPEKTHGMNKFASATCATDGECVIAFFGRGGIHSYDFEGEKLWSRDLGAFEGPWGTGASPVLFDDVVIQNCDAEDKACMLGLNKKTGETLWETPRERLRGWSSPYLVKTDGRAEVVVNGEKGVHAYEPLTGEELWFCKGDRGRGTPTVTQFQGILIALSGRTGGRTGDLFAIRPGGNGTVNATHEVWRAQRKGGRDLGSPIVVDRYLVVVNLRPGVATCYDAATGKELDQQRLEGGFSASPVTANGLIYIPNEKGRVFVLKPGDKLEVVAANSLPIGDNEIFRASITPHRGEMLIRSDRMLYCVGKP